MPDTISQTRLQHYEAILRKKHFGYALAPVLTEDEIDRYLVVNVVLYSQQVDGIAVDVYPTLDKVKSDIESFLFDSRQAEDYQYQADVYDLDTGKPVDYTVIREARFVSPMIEPTQMAVSIDGGTTYFPAPEGVKVIYPEEKVPGADDDGELHVNLTNEGMILDVWGKDHDDNDYNIGTSSQTAGEIVAQLVQDASQPSIERMMQVLWDIKMTASYHKAEGTWFWHCKYGAVRDVEHGPFPTFLDAVKAAVEPYMHPPEGEKPSER